MLTASWDNTARILRSIDPLRPFLEGSHGDWLSGAVWSPDGARFVAATVGQAAWIWRSDGGGAPIVLRGQENVIRSVRWSPDGARVLTAAGNNTRIWRADREGDSVVLRGHQDDVLSAAWKPDGAGVVHHC